VAAEPEAYALAAVSQAPEPFRRMLVKLKREIITMKKPAIKPELGRFEEKR